MLEMAAPLAAEPAVAPLVTIALPTFGRADALRCAVRSVLAQSVPGWQLWVIGDACEASTGEAMRRFLGDRRIRFVNLPSRCGEQALLNSAVMALARTEYVAFLNHDDLWLPEHLAIALAALAEPGADFFMGRSAWAWGGHADDSGVPQFESVSPEPRDLAACFASGIHYIEPVSAWVIRRSLAERVGPWSRAADIFRTPIQEWALRAWRSGAMLVGSQQVSCLKFENHWAKEAPSKRYEVPAQLQECALSTLGDPDSLQWFRGCLAELASRPGAIGHRMQLEAVGRGDARLKVMAGTLLTAETAELYRCHGLDAYSWFCVEAGLERGWRWKAALAKRTGETDLTPPTFEQVVDAVARSLERPV